MFTLELTPSFPLFQQFPHSAVTAQIGHSLQFAHKRADRLNPENAQHAQYPQKHVLEGGVKRRLIITVMVASGVGAGARGRSAACRTAHEHATHTSRTSHSSCISHRRCHTPLPGGGQIYVLPYEIAAFPTLDLIQGLPKKGLTAMEPSGNLEQICQKKQEARGYYEHVARCLLRMGAPSDAFSALERLYWCAVEALDILKMDEESTLEAAQEEEL